MLLLLLVPLSYGLVNLADKYIISEKVGNPRAYIVVVGLVHLVLGSLLAAVLPWVPLRPHELALLVTIGVLYAFQIAFYFVLFKTEDATNIVGIDYAYPVVVVLLSWWLLGERLGTAGYLGILLILLGIATLIGRMAFKSLRAHPVALLVMVLVTGVTEFIIKVSTFSVPEMQGVAVNSVVAGTVVLLLLARGSVRKDVLREIRNIGWAFGAETLTIAAVACIFLAMARYPASVVVGIAALQPLVVFAGERALGERLATRDTKLWPKLTGLSLVVVGAILLLRLAQ